jgi:pilus assembly protein FimV
VRKISKTMAVMGLLTPFGASALGIGDIRLHSALNQLLNAEIPLVTSGSESVSDVRVSLASPDAFSRAGIERHYVLSKLRFSPVQKPDGSYVIKVSSQDVIREPFLNFLVEVNWPQGRLFREFTVLLDPPAAFKESAVGTPALPGRHQGADSSGPSTDETPVYPHNKFSATPSLQTGRAADERRVQGSQFGPVRRNETLWNIARLVNRDRSVTQEQMAIALYQANPHAFYKDSVNALKAGETLKIPDRETILRMSPQEARAEFYRQTHTGQLSARAAEKADTPPADGEQVQGQLKLLAASDSKAKTESALPNSKEDGTKTKENIALEVADTVKQENEEIRSRLAQLEQQLSSMQRMLSLKDEQIATIQAQQKAPSQNEFPSDSVAEKPAATQERPAQAELPAQPEPPKDAAATPQPAPAAAELSAPLPAAAAQKPQPAPLPSSEDTGLLSELLDEPQYLYYAGGAALLVGLVAWLAIRRRASMIEEMESILAASELRKPQRTPAAAPATDETSADQVVTTAKSSFLSEFTPSDFDALAGESDEVDPISEADVYLAYGRYKQAEELIRNAIEQYPEKDECKLKLLEIHYATENKQAFESYAKEIFEQDEEPDPQFWDKVVEMGRELCPESPLFRGPVDTLSSNAGPLDVADIHGSFTGSVDFSSDLAESIDLDHELMTDLKGFEQTKGKPTDEFDMNVFAPTETSTASAPASLELEAEQEPESLASLDFDLSSISAAKLSENVSDSEPPLRLDNLIQFETSKPSTTKIGTISAQTHRDKTLDDILIELGANPEPAPRIAEDLSKNSHVAKDEFDFDLEMVSPPREAPLRSGEIVVGENGEGFTDLTDMDEQETKLDLAKAYVDMGDEEAAREILEDVMEKGNEVQKMEARTRRDELTKR